jgi:DNA (cytosine-5)-methyltransferase 1
MKKNNMKPGVLDLFSGPGGLSLGFMMEGFDIVYSNDIDRYAVSTISANHKKISKALKRPHYHVAEAKDIKNLQPNEVEKIFEEREFYVHGIIGGPPCKGFSMANMQSRFLENPNNMLFKEYIKFVEGLKPDFFLFENVVGFLSMGKGKIKEMAIKILRELNGYNVECSILNSSEYGVPQTRKRVIIIGHKHLDAKQLFPMPNIDNNPITVGEAMADLPEIKSGERRKTQYYPKSKTPSNYAKKMRQTPEFNIASKKVLNHITTNNSSKVLERYKHIPQGGNWKDIPDKLLKDYKDKKRCHSSIYKRLDENQPSITVSNFRKSMFIHPTQNRGISVREAARLQSFPDWYEFIGPINSQQQQVADAVPPLMARAIAKKIKQELKNNVYEHMDDSKKQKAPYIYS